MSVFIDVTDKTSKDISDLIPRIHHYNIKFRLWRETRVWVFSRADMMTMASEDNSLPSFALKFTLDKVEIMVTNPNDEPLIRLAL